MAGVPLGYGHIFETFNRFGDPDMVAAISLDFIAPGIVCFHVVGNRSHLTGEVHFLPDIIKDGIGSLRIEIRHHDNRKIIRIESLQPLADKGHRTFT